MTTQTDSPVVEKDLVLVYVDGNPAFFARIEGFEADTKPKWWRVKLLVLQIPMNVVTWVLRHEQINGEEFTMGGTPIRLEKVKVPQESDLAPAQEEEPSAEEPEKEEAPAEEETKKSARILSLGSPPKDTE